MSKSRGALLGGILAVAGIGVTAVAVVVVYRLSSAHPGEADCSRTRVTPVASVTPFSGPGRPATAVGSQTPAPPVPTASGGAVDSPAIQLSVKGKNGQIARLLTGQSMNFSDATGWVFRVSDARVLEQDNCPGKTTSFRALQPGSSLLEALSSSAGGAASQILHVTVIVDRATPILPALARDPFVAHPVALLSTGQTVEVAMPTDFQYLAWQHATISDPRVLRRVDISTPAGRGLVVLQAMEPGRADLTADAKSASSSVWPAGFFRIEFVVRPPSRVSDVASGVQDSGKTVSLGVGQILAFSPKPAGPPSVISQSAKLGQPLLIPLETPTLGGDSETHYLMAQAAGTEKILWTSCPSTGPIAASCQPEVTVKVVPSGAVSVEASDADGQKRFTMRRGEEIQVALHPYIAPWQGISSSAPDVLRPVANEVVAGIQLWTFRAVAPGLASLNASYSCPSGVGCPLLPSITVDVRAD